MEDTNEELDGQHANHKRRPDWKQIGLGGGLAVSLMTLTPLKNFVYTREEGTALHSRVDDIKQNTAAQISELKATYVLQNAEQTRVLERRVDKILEAIGKVEERYARENDKQDRRIETLEASVLKRSTRM